MLGKARILYVEDNTDNRKLVRRVLEAEGYEVIEAQDGRQALERLESQPIDLALMDINMPDIDGLGFLRSGRARRLHRRSIV